MDGQQQPSVLEQLSSVVYMAAAFDSCCSTLSTTKGVNLGSVESWELVDADVLDEKEKPTGKTYQCLLLSLRGGNQIEITDAAEIQTFLKFWNQKCKIDQKKGAFAVSIFNQMFPEQNQLTGAAK